jgi:microcompartment protein CcmK/EutM
MVIGKVIGNLWATRKDEKLHGLKLLVVQHTDLQEQPKSSYVVAVDAVGAGVGDLVMVTTGSSARQSELTAGKPVDAVISGIIDRIDVGQ